MKIHPLTDFPERFSSLDQVILEKDGEIVEACISQAHYRGKKIILKFDGCNDRDSAERMRGYLITIPRAEVGLLPEDSYYAFELAGVRVYTTDEELIGMVSDTYSVGSEDLLEVERMNDNGRFLIPFVKQFVKQVDIPGQKLVVELIDGLE